MASATLDQFVTNTRTLTSQGNFKQLSDHVRQSMELLARNNHATLDNALGTLQMQEHSIGVLGILLAKFLVKDNKETDFETLFTQLQEFIGCCNGEQVRHAVDSYTMLCHKFTEALVKQRKAMRGIPILVKAIQKIQLSQSQLTSVQADLYQLCLVSKCFNAALPFLEQEVTDISKEDTTGHIDVKYYLLYYYYGGMIYTSLKKYDRALFFFEVCITTPASTISSIMVEAYKKFVLVALVLHGKIPILPRYTSQVVGRNIKPTCQCYHDLATSFNNNQANQMLDIVAKHQEIFNNDKNTGLVKQCIVSWHKKNIQKLTQTFLTLSLSDLASRVQLPNAREAEKHVLQMIEDGEIYATINRKDGMVSFHDNPEKYNNTAIVAKLDIEMQKCMELDRKLQELDKDIVTDRKFIQKSSGMYEEDSGSALKLPPYSM